MSDQTEVNDVDEKKQNNAATNGTKLKWRSIHFIVENEKKKEEKTAGVQRWLKQKQLMNKMYDDTNFKSLSSHSRLKKEMTEASAQMEMVDWIAQHFDQHIVNNEGAQCLIIDICSGKGFFGVLSSHILPQSQIILVDKNKKMNITHFDSCTNVSFHIVDIRAFKFSLSKWIRNEFSKYNKPKLILFGTHLCGELSQVLIDAFNELSDIAWCLFLVPCCYPKKDKIINKAKELEMDAMDYWLKILQEQVKRSPNDNILLECTQMTQMLSEKNYLIRILRQNMHSNHSKTDNNENKNENYNDMEAQPPLKKRKIVT